MIKLVVFDLDNVIIDGEAIDEIGKLANVEEDIAEITEKAMQGEIDFETSIKDRVQLLEGTSIEDIEKVADDLPLMNGACKTINCLKEKDVDVAVDRQTKGGGLSEESGSLIPDFKDVVDECMTNGYKVSANTFYEYYRQRDWKTTNGEPVRNWKVMLKVWDAKERGESPAAALAGSKPKGKNKFNNFDQREYNDDELEAFLLAK